MSEQSTTPPEFAGRELPAWYDDAKFGIFIHWGPYAVPCYAPLAKDMGEMMASGDWTAAFRDSPYVEWYLNSWAIPGSSVEAHHAQAYGPDVAYADFVEEFRARSAGASVAHWADLFAGAGARYVVPITKHHDGFLMWRSGVPNPGTSALVRGPWMAERDHVGELCQAVRANGMRFGVYYSGGLDWTFRAPGIDSIMALIGNIPTTPDYCDYVNAHVDELIARFNPSVLWNDIAWPMTLDPNDVFRRYYAAVPDGVVNDRWNIIAVRSGTLHADFATPEYSTTPPSAGKWEVCRGIGRSFGYNRMEGEDTMLAVDDLVWMLVDIVARGGNLLLNVGPTAEGTIPFAQALRLTALGWWLRVNGDAIYGTRPAPVAVTTTGDGREVRCTVGDRGAGAWYACVQGAPAGELVLSGIAAASAAGADGAEVRLVGNDRVLAHTVRGDDVVVQLPDHLPAAPVTVLQIAR